MKAWEYVHSFTQAFQALSSSSSAQTKLDVKFPLWAIFPFWQESIKMISAYNKKKNRKRKRGKWFNMLQY